MKANDVARYLLAITDEDCGEVITHLKLQKLCYYAQGFHLAIADEPLFGEEIEAWQHGPVVPQLWHEYNLHGSEVIPAPEELDRDAYSEGDRGLLDDVYEIYGQFSAWKLRNMTHIEPPWVEAWQRAERGGSAVISHESMKDYFKTLVEE